MGSAKARKHSRASATRPELKVTPPAEYAAIWPKYRRQIVFVCVGLTVLTFLAFGRAATNGFVDLDDPHEIYENPYVKDGFLPGSISWAFRETQLYYWEPVTYLSHMLDCQVFGLNAGAHHLVSVGIHALTASLLFLALFYMTGSVWRSALVAAVFAVHPLRVESVVWLSERRDVLTGVFTVLTLWSYAWYARRPGSWERYSLVFAAFWLALMSKPMAVTVPAVLLILDFWPLRRLDRDTALKLVLEKIPLFFSSAVISFLTLTSNTGQLVSSVRYSHGGYSRLDRIAAVFVNCAAYLGKLVYPRSLATLYSPIHPGFPGAAASVLAFALISIVALRTARSRPWIVAGWLWFLIMLLPVMGFAIEDRLTYLPLIGPCLTLTWLASDWLRRQPRLQPLAIGAAAVLLLGLSALSWRQTAFWKDSLTLYRRSMAVVPDHRGLLYRYAGALASAGLWNEAERNYRESIGFQSNQADVHIALAEVLERQSKVPEAFAEYRQALALDPTNVTALKELSVGLIRSGAYSEALPHLQLAHGLAPDDPAIGQLLEIITTMEHSAAAFPARQ